MARSDPKQTRQYNQRYYIKHKEKLKDAAKRWREENPEKYAESWKAWAAKDPEKVKETKRRWYRNNRARQQAGILKRQYGLSQDKYTEMSVLQEGKCAICTEVPLRKLNVDHCHRTGEIRGLLCGSCNRTLGLMKDNPDRLERAAAYLRARERSSVCQT